MASSSDLRLAFPARIGILALMRACLGAGALAAALGVIARLAASWQQTDFTFVNRNPAIAHMHPPLLCLGGS
jgi:hypothetical protein